MKHITRALAGATLAYLVASSAHAASIQSLTIEEIGVILAGLGTSTLQSIGGEAAIYDNNNNLYAASGFVSVATYRRRKLGQ